MSLVDALRRPSLAELVPDRAAEDARKALRAHDDEGGESPAPIRALVGFGAWLAALLLVILAVVIGFDNDGGGSFVGLVAIGVGVALRRTAGPGSIFRSQFALSLSLAGHALVIGFIAADGDALAGGLTASALGVAGLLLMPDPVHRFASTLLVVGGVTVGAFDVAESSLVPGIALILSAPVWIASFWFEPRWQASRWADMQLPVGFGLAASVALLSTPLVMPGFGQGAALAGLAMTAMLAGLARAIAVERGHRIGGASVLGVLALFVALGWIGLEAPGVVAAAIAMVLAVERRHPVLLGCAITFFVGFLATWYYQMDLSLFAKAGALAGGGVLFLLARAALARGGDR